MEAIIGMIAEIETTTMVETDTNKILINNSSNLVLWPLAPICLGCRLLQVQQECHLALTVLQIHMQLMVDIRLVSEFDVSTIVV